ncbi:glycoside hydrolase family protein [Paracoccus siganidrum]|nr:lysozyme [Paracoccus siganidrum]
MSADLDAALSDVFTVFRRDLAKYEGEVYRALTGMTVEQRQFDAAVGCHFNTGVIGRADWIKRWRLGGMGGTLVGIMNWSKPKEIIDPWEAEQTPWATGRSGGPARRSDRSARRVVSPGGRCGRSRRRKFSR